jgi:hypothetical protein
MGGVPGGGGEKLRGGQLAEQSRAGNIEHGENERSKDNIWVRISERCVIKRQNMGATVRVV